MLRKLTTCRLGGAPKSRSRSHGWLCDVVLIGAQALAAEQVAAGEDPLLQVETDTGQRVVRGYSFEPDLLIEAIDSEQSARWDELPEILRSCGYQRGGRDFQWEKRELVRFVPRLGLANDERQLARISVRAAGVPSIRHVLASGG